MDLNVLNRNASVLFMIGTKLRSSRLLHTPLAVIGINLTHDCTLNGHCLTVSTSVFCFNSYYGEYFDCLISFDTELF